MQTSHHTHKKSFFIWLVLALCLIYYAIEFCYVNYAMFSVDDFWLSFHTYQYRNQLPYRDFSPYKTVLGYYLTVFPMLLAKGSFQSILFIKEFIALINTILLVISTLWLKKFFPKAALLTSLAILIFSSIFITYSAEARVDVLAYFFCLFSVLFVFEKKFLTAGITIGIAFLISQKALVYIISTDCALVGMWLLGERKQIVRDIFLFTISALLPILLYILFWAAFSNFHTVIKNIFYDAYIVSNLNDYQVGRIALWKDIVSNNIFLFLLLPFAWLSLFVPPQVISLPTRIFIAIYSLMVTLFVVSYKQPFLYNMIILIPAYVLLFSTFFAWAYLVCNRLFTRVIFTSMIILLGVIWPLTRLTVTLPDVNGGYQKAMLSLADHLLEKNDTYIAGTFLFPNKNYPVVGLKHLTLPALHYLNHPTAAMQNVMLPSLYLEPVNPKQILQSIQDNAVKLYVNNYRITMLPDNIKNYLASEFQHYWGSIYLYAPTVAREQKRISIKFSGNYKIQSQGIIKIDNKNVAPRSIVFLSKGSHRSHTDKPYRLQLIPENADNYLKKSYQAENLRKIFI